MQVIDLSDRSEVDEYNKMARRENRRLAKASLNLPDDYATLKYPQQRYLQLWIRRTFTPCGRVHRLSSYALKHYFENDGGFYVTNGAFKGAMLAAGFQPTKATASDINWRFKLKLIRDLSHVNPI